MRLTLTTFALLAITALPLSAQTAAPTDAPSAAEAPSAIADPAAEAVVAGSYAFDPQHSHIVYTYEHMGFSTSTGLVRGVTGTITLDPADPAAATVEASFPLSSLKTVSADLDEHIMGPDFFNGEAPETAITFTSTTVEVTGDQTATVTGDLTLNGQTKPVTLDVTLRKAGEDPIVGALSVGFQATGTVKRSDFGLGAFAPAVSDEVQVTINVEAHKG